MTISDIVSGDANVVGSVVSADDMAVTADVTIALEAVVGPTTIGVSTPSGTVSLPFTGRFRHQLWLCGLTPTGGEISEHVDGPA